MNRRNEKKNEIDENNEMKCKINRHENNVLGCHSSVSEHKCNGAVPQQEQLGSAKPLENT